MQQKHQHPSSWSIVVTFCMQFCLCFELGLIGGKKREKKRVDKQTIRWLLLTCKFSSPFPNNKCLLGLPCKMVVYYLHQEPRARQWARMRNHGLCKNCNRIQQNLLFMHPLPSLRSPFSCNINQLTLLVWGWICVNCGGLLFFYFCFIPGFFLILCSRENHFRFSISRPGLWGCWWGVWF